MLARHPDLYAGGDQTKALLVTPLLTLKGDAEILRISTDDLWRIKASELPDDLASALGDPASQKTNGRSSTTGMQPSDPV